MPELSIVIPTLNRGKMFHDTVRQVLAQRFTDYEFWLIDQSDPAQRAENEALVAALSDARIRYLHIGVKGLPNARNEALARVSGKIVLFLDDDVILLRDDFVEAHVETYADTRVGGVTGRIVERSVRPNVAKVSGHLSKGGRTLTNAWGTEKCEIFGLKGANMSYRAEAIADVGGFDRNYKGTALLEDTDYSTRVHKAGWTLIFEPRAEMVHLSAASGGVRVEDALRAEYWRFRSTAYFVLKNRGPRAFPRFLATFGAIAASRAVRWRSPAVVSKLADAIRDGVSDFRAGPDQAIPLK